MPTHRSKLLLLNLLMENGSEVDMMLLLDSGANVDARTMQVAPFYTMQPEVAVKR